METLEAEVVDVEQKIDRSPKGLKRLRASWPISTLRKACANCGCKRYSPCGCKK